MEQANDLWTDDACSWTARTRAVDLMHGALEVERGDGGWSRPSRFLRRQTRALSSCVAWHPGLFSQMARCTSGISLEFETDAQHLALEVMADPVPRGSVAVLEAVSGYSEANPLDGVSCDVDGAHLPARLPEGGRAYVPPRHASSSRGDDEAERELAPKVFFDLAPGEPPTLPGLGVRRHVRLWLPALRGCVVRDVICDGMYLRPCDQRPTLLVLGDSISQGFVTADPGWAWPSVVSRELGCDLVNQGIGGQVFQPGSLVGLEGIPAPSRVVVALGANYRYEPCREGAVAADVAAFLDEVEGIWPKAHVWVASPTWHDEDVWPTHPRSCYESVPDVIRTETARHRGWAFVDGLGLMDHDVALLADRSCHPNRTGAEQMAMRMISSMGADD